MLDTPMTTPSLTAAPVEEVNAIVDSRHWNDVPLRADDVIVSSYGKAGTTWTLQIIIQLLHGAPEVARVGNIARWVDALFDHEARVAAVNAETGRRILKSHLSAAALPFAPGVRYVYVARDGRDVAWSMHNHLRSSEPAFHEGMGALCAARGVEPFAPLTDDPAQTYRAWLGHPAGISYFWHHLRSWWALRDHPQVKILHFQNLKDDLPAEVRRMAGFLGLDPDPELAAKTIKHAGFAHMKAKAREMFPEMPMVNGGDSFINKGTNGRWRDALSAEEIAWYEAQAVQELGPDCAHWLATGER